MDDTPKPLDLEAIKARVSAATVGPWTYSFSPPNQYGHRVATVYAQEYVNFGSGPVRVHGLNLFGRMEPDSNGTANLEFVVHARTDIPALVAEVERLREALRFYAIEQYHSFEDTGYFRSTAVDYDGGRTARAALGMNDA